MIITQTPLRMSFFGGGTDFKNYYLDNGGAVLSTTINKFIYVIIKERFDDLIVLNYSKKEIVNSVDAIKHEIIREALRMTGVDKGVEITTLADIPSEGTGLGSSSSVAVGLLHALHIHQGNSITAEDLAKQACKIEIDILDKPIGIQDQYAAAFGNMNLLSFTERGCQVAKVNISLTEKRILSNNMILYYTGVTRKASDILSDQNNNINQNTSLLSEIKQMASEAEKLIVKNAFDEFGALLHRGWELKKKLSKNISTDYIDDIYQTARKAGALGGKILGAGGGGFLLLYCNGHQETVRQELKSLKELSFMFSQYGSRVIFDNRLTG